MGNLTARQSQVLKLVARGYSNKQIAVELGIGEQTVKAHVSEILYRLGAANRTDAVVRHINEVLGREAL